MRAEVEATRLEIESKLRCDSLGEGTLPIGRKFALDHFRRTVAQRIDYRNKLGAELRKESRQLLGRHAGLVVVEQCVVSHARKSDGVGLLPREREGLVEPR